MSASITARTTFELQDSASGRVEASLVLLREAALRADETLDESSWDIETETMHDTSLGDVESVEIPTWRKVTVSTLPREVEL